MGCNICQAETIHFASAKVMQKYDAEYVRCPICDFIQADNPYWLDDAYSSAITTSDIGLVSRNLAFSRTAKTVIELLYDPRGAFIDYGGGTGLLTRLMRDYGYDFSCQDSHCDNHFAEHFSAKQSAVSNYELLTSVEVFEHLVDPLATLRDMKNMSKNILFTTQILPVPVPEIENWWYYGLDHGQHIAFYGVKSLVALAESLGLNFSTNGSNLHLFSEKRVSSSFFKILTSRICVTAISTLRRRPSLLNSDFNNIRKQTGGDNADCS